MIYTPDPVASGPDAFAYTVQDGEFSAEGTVTVWVMGRTLHLPTVAR